MRRGLPPRPPVPVLVPLTPPPSPTVEEGPVFALCMAGAGDRRTLGKWIAGLQEANPVLGQTPVVFRLQDGDPLPAPPPAPRLGDQSPPAAALEPPDPPRGHGGGGGPGAPPAASGE